MNTKSTLIASALVSTLVAGACGTESSSPGVSGYVPLQSAANFEEGLVVAAHQDASAPGRSSQGGHDAQPRTRTRCRMASDAVEQWLTNGVVPRCQLVTTPRHGHEDGRRTR